MSSRPTYPNPISALTEEQIMAILEKPIDCGLINTGMPYIPTLSDLHIPVKRKPSRERELSPEEFLSLFSKKEALKVAYIPHYLTICAINYLDQLIGYARTNRLSDYKRHTRMLKAMREEYFDSLRREMSEKVYQSFLDLRFDYLESCGANLNLMYFTISNQMLKKYDRIKHDTFYILANIILFFIKGVEDFDRKCNQMIAERIGEPCRNHGDARLIAIKKVCQDIVKDYPLESDAQVETCIKVMANKAVEMIDKMQ